MIDRLLISRRAGQLPQSPTGPSTSWRLATKVFALLFLTLPLARAGTLSDPAVDSYNVHVGTQTFAGLYQFTTNTLLVETAQAIEGLGSDIIKGYLGSDFSKQYHINLPSNVTNLLTLARDEPSCHQMLDMPFRHFVLWAYPFGNSWPFDGYSASEAADDYKEMFDLTCYFLTNYNNSGKTFYLGHWEGDWYLLPNYNTSTNPSPIAIEGMINWLNNRQKAIDDAKKAVQYTNVNVFGYAEVVRVLDALSGNTNINQRMINKVIPYVTNLDYLSYSSYDVMNASAATLDSDLNFIESNLPTNKASVVPGQRIWIGEYGWGGSYSTAAQEPLTRAYIQRLLAWGPLRFILFWEIYDNETNKNYCLIDSNNVKVASYYLHQRFINDARLLTAQFKETHGQLPNDSEFASFTIPLLNQPLPPPVRLSLSNAPARLLDPSSASVSGTLAQGIYGDDQADVWVFWGRQDGGVTRAAWEQGRFLGVNTHFNPATFSTVLTNLVPQTNYYFRFYATNSAAESWAPASASFTTSILNPQDYGSRFRITFSGYARGEALLKFPVLVTLSTNLPGFSYRHFASPTGGDLRFTDAGGLMVIPHEIDEWNTNGASYVWVQVPQLSGPTDFIWAYWGNPLAASPEASSTNGAVWSPGYDLVWHLKENGFPYADSAQQHPAQTGVKPLSTPGLVGRGVQFDGVSQYLDAGPVNLGSAFTLSAWVKLDPAATNIQTIWANKPGGYNSPGFALFVNSYQTADGKLTLETGNGTLGLAASTTSYAVTTNGWHYVAAAIDEAAGTAHLYVDGADETQSGSIRTDFPNQTGINLARFTNSSLYWQGAMDEARIQAGACSSNWAWASWMTGAANTGLATYSAIKQLAPLLSLVAGSGNIVLQWPASAVGFTLYTATNLTPPLNWMPAPIQPVLSNNQWQTQIPADTNVSAFFRLQE